MVYQHFPVTSVTTTYNHTSAYRTPTDGDARSTVQAHTTSYAVEDDQKRMHANESEMPFGTGKTLEEIGSIDSRMANHSSSSNEHHSGTQRSGSRHLTLADDELKGNGSCLRFDLSTWLQKHIYEAYQKGSQIIFPLSTFRSGADTCVSNGSESVNSLLSSRLGTGTDARDEQKCKVGKAAISAPKAPRTCHTNDAPSMTTERWPGTFVLGFPTVSIQDARAFQPRNDTSIMDRIGFAMQSLLASLTARWHLEHVSGITWERSERAQTAPKHGATTTTTSTRKHDITTTSATTTTSKSQQRGDGSDSRVSATFINLAYRDWNPFAMLPFARQCKNRHTTTPGSTATMSGPGFGKFTQSDPGATKTDSSRTLLDLKPVATVPEPARSDCSAVPEMGAVVESTYETHSTAVKSRMPENRELHDHRVDTRNSSPLPKSSAEETAHDSVEISTFGGRDTPAYRLRASRLTYSILIWSVALMWGLWWTGLVHRPRLVNRTETWLDIGGKTLLTIDGGIFFELYVTILSWCEPCGGDDGTQLLVQLLVNLVLLAILLSFEMRAAFGFGFAS